MRVLASGSHIFPGTAILRKIAVGGSRWARNMNNAVIDIVNDIAGEKI